MERTFIFTNAPQKLFLDTYQKRSSIMTTQFKEIINFRVEEINFTIIQIYGILRIKVFTEAKKNQLQEKTFVDETVSQ